MEYMDQQWEMGDLTLYFFQGYESQYGISLSKRSLVAIITAPKNQLAEQSQLNYQLDASEISEVYSFDVSENAKLEIPQDAIEINEGVSCMWAIEPPVIPTPDQHTVQLVQADSAAIAVAAQQSAAGVCHTSAFVDGQGSKVDLYAPGIAGTYMYRYKNKEISFSNADKVIVLQQPKNGILNSKANEYLPHKDFMGLDSFTVQIHKNNVKVNIKYYVIVADGPNTNDYLCRKIPNKPIDIDPWKISQFGQPDTTSNDLAAWQRSATLSALIASAQQTLTGFTDLPATALGKTTGEGTSAQITLDQNAAGHGWYIDPTPLDNSDNYLPTSNPTVFKAKAGSAADGKMDMLSVLLHEYGHALGLEHSGNGADFMAASLQPGVRKLPSAAELTLMARLVAELKGAGGEALTLALSQGERGQVQGESEQDPSNPSSPLPSPSPLSALGLLPLGFMRHNDGKGSANAGVATGAATASHIDYLTAINTTLANGSFSVGQNASIDQWESVGNVAATPAVASQVVMLGESTTAQAHLAQAFVLSAQDRFLTFTVSGLDLQTNSIERGDVFTAAPQDAFEVALQNANTGANLLANGVGGVGNYPF